jgi:hypothetical protein
MVRELTVPLVRLRLEVRTIRYILSVRTIIALSFSETAFARSISALSIFRFVPIISLPILPHSVGNVASMEAYFLFGFYTVGLFAG